MKRKEPENAEEREKVHGGTSCPKGRMLLSDWLWACTKGGHIKRWDIELTCSGVSSIQWLQDVSHKSQWLGDRKR